jgi:hypothetical protein
MYYIEREERRQQMPLPPFNPIMKDGRETNYFQVLAGWAGKILNTEQEIKLNFTGYTETLIQYAELKEEDISNAWRLAKELNTWAEYFSSLANLIQKIYLDADTTKIEVQADSSIRSDATKVSNGDRLSNKDILVVNARKTRNTLQAFHEELQAKTKFLERAHYHCKATYDGKVKAASTLPNKSATA